MQHKRSQVRIEYTSYLFINPHNNYSINHLFLQSNQPTTAQHNTANCFRNQNNQPTNASILQFKQYISHILVQKFSVIFQLRIEYQQMSQKILVSIIQNKLYFLADDHPPKYIPNALYFNIDNDLTYQAFYEDFGPLDIATIYKYVRQVQKPLFHPNYDRSVFYHHTSPRYKTCCNSVLLICALQMICLGRSSQQAYKPFHSIQLRAFRDASLGKCSYQCREQITDCLAGLQYAMKLHWFDYKTFNLAEYQHLDKFENGDLNWIIPQKLIAFSSPSDFKEKQSMSTKDYVQVFQKLNVKAVVRLNQPNYDQGAFQSCGVKHYDLYFDDGTVPRMDVVERFLQIVEETDGAVAVHCKAGLGRTGCLIACYAMKHFHFPAAFFIGWIRLCRPGSILGPQQHFLVQNEHIFHQKSQSSPIWKQLSKKENINQLLAISNYSFNHKKRQLKMNKHELQIHHNGDKGQGSRLVQARSNHHSYSNNQLISN